MGENISTTWVVPFYRNILHGNFAYGNSDGEFVSKAQKALKVISPGIIDLLFSEVNWRDRITAAWFCGLKEWRQYGDIIGASLLESRFVYAGQGYCFALAHFADEKSANYLVRYLETYLPQIDKYYDQGWAIGALMWIDEKRGTNLSLSFLTSGGLWETFVAEKVTSSNAWTLEFCKERFYKVMKCSIETFK